MKQIKNSSSDNHLANKATGHAVHAGCIVVALLASLATAAACPYCESVSPTLTQEIKTADIAVLAELVAPPLRATGADVQTAPGVADGLEKSKFKIVEVLKGKEYLKNVTSVEAVYLGESSVDSQFLIIGIDPKDLTWATPIALSKRGRKYVDQLAKLPESGPERLVFFQDYLEDKEEMLRSDAYNEFALAPYDAIKAFGSRADYAQLIRWLKLPDVSLSHRRLYFTLLGVCGSEKDAPMLEAWLSAKDRGLKAGLDAMIGAYLALKGAGGLVLVETLFLKNKDAESTDTFATIQAIRIAEEAGIINKNQAATTFHAVLDRPKLADLVVADLARWQDWTAINRLVKLFMLPADESAFIRVPVLRYLHACPLPEAKKQLEKLQTVDPVAAKQAQSYFSPPSDHAKAPAETPSEKRGK